MKSNSEKNILIALFLNIFFVFFEIIGGMITNSVAILSDAIHDAGDALSITISYFLERKSKKKADEEYSFGYVRYSVLGSVVTTCLLIVGSIIMAYNSICRLFNPVSINYDGMLIIAIVGTLINVIAICYTESSDSLNQKAVNLHMLEDALGWIIVLIGSIIMKITNIQIIDSLLSIGVAIFIFISSLKNLKEVLDIFLEKTPSRISVDQLKEKVLKIDGVDDVFHIHIWSIDGINNYATMHVITKDNSVKEEIRKRLRTFGIVHITIETDVDMVDVKNTECVVRYKKHI